MRQHATATAKASCFPSPLYKSCSEGFRDTPTSENPEGEYTQAMDFIGFNAACELKARRNSKPAPAIRGLFDGLPVHGRGGASGSNAEPVLRTIGGRTH